MIDPLPPIQATTYARWMRWAGYATHLIGMQLHVKGAQENLRNGEIFLFNHFTRLETTVPPYLLFKQTGAFTRSVTHHGLYHVHNFLRRFLLDTGCVPSNLPNLLPYLAAEVLRGRKVVIFPEGGLVKDKKVFDARGHYAVKGADNRAARPHHRGAAVLAVYLDIFKAHIRDANTQGDTATLAHWVAELNLPSLPHLLAACAQPTRVVPSTLTFFPIRGEGNWVTRTVQALFGELPERALDELTMETNLLLRPTDLDLYVGAALPAAWAPPKAEAMLWRHALRNITTLEQLFALELDHAQWLHAPLIHRAQGAVERQRDRSTRALYGGLTVNLHHVVATLIDEYHQAGRNEVPAPEFEAAVLWAAYRLQEQAKRNPLLPLHASIGEALALSQLAQGTHYRYARFIETLRSARLVKRSGGSGGIYRFSQRLNDAVGVHEIRTENPVLLHVNEAATQPAVRLAVMWAVQQASQLSTPTGQQAWAGVVLQAQRATALEAYNAAGSQALAAGAQALQPFLLIPNNTDAPANGVGVLMLHGLGASPAQMRPLAEELRALGHTVYGLRLPGHGGKPEDLFGQNERDWLATTTLGVKLLQAHGMQKIILLGFSTGALVALNTAQRHTEAVAGAVLVAPPVQLVSPLRHLLQTARVLNLLVAPTLGRFIPLLRHGVYPWYTMAPRYPAEQYTRVPLGAVAALQTLAKRGLRKAAKMVVPVTIVHGSADQVAALAASQTLATVLGPRGKLVVLPEAAHDVLRTNTANSWAQIIQAVTNIADAQPEGLPDA